jgi:hypothetical protein
MTGFSIGALPPIYMNLALNAAHVHDARGERDVDDYYSVSFP